MCGIVGIADTGGVDAIDITRMRDVLTHRGPDDCGLYIDRNVGLGHRRLSIIDLSPRSRQPMATADNQLQIVFNGEIYNYIELRNELRGRGCVFHTESDTEVILHAYREYGPACVHKLNGMFAFAIWNTKERTLFLARDRVGIKPLYYALEAHRIVFASEIKAVLCAPGMERRANESAVRQYWESGLPGTADTWFVGVYQLLPGHWAIWKDGDLYTRLYWEFVQEEDRRPSQHQWIEQLRNLLEDSVKLTLRSDVPVGTHLSGGIDSSTVTTIAAKHALDTVNTFSGRFREGEPWDEGSYIRLVADRIAARTHEIVVTPEFFQEALGPVAWHMDHPLAGPGVVPQYAVCLLTKQNNIKVVLGGQGGDELFAGYFDNYQPYLSSLARRLWDPRCAADAILTANRLLRIAGPGRLNQVRQQRRFRRQGQQFLTPELLQVTAENETVYPPRGANALERKLYWDLKYRLPALLHVEDRVSMAASIESRVPLLDFRLVELAARIPFYLKFRHGEPKHILRRAVDDLLPGEIRNRRDKIGFSLPLRAWFSGPLAGFVQEIVGSRSLRERGIFSKTAFAEILRPDAAAQRAGEIWQMISIEMWYRTFLDPASLSAPRGAPPVLEYETQSRT